jgi:flagellin-like hook-associated protein FlgL
MSGELSLRFSAQAQVDMRRITGEFADLQRQLASGVRANDLQGFGGASSQILSARSMKASTEAQIQLRTELDARFGVQTAALGQVADAAGDLALAIRQAISANDGRGIATSLELAFNSAVSALNESWNGQPLFAGERQGDGPIRIATLDELLSAVTPDALFNEAARNQVIDVGESAPIVLSAKASTLSQGLFDTLRTLKQLIVSSGGSLGQPITPLQESQLFDIVADLDAHAESFTNEEGRTGQLQKRFEADLERLQARSNLLTKELGERADADLAEVSIRLNSLMAQYEASAKTFVDLSRLSLLNYL